MHIYLEELKIIKESPYIYHAIDINMSASHPLTPQETRDLQFTSLGSPGIFSLLGPWLCFLSLSGGGSLNATIQDPSTGHRFEDRAIPWLKRLLTCVNKNFLIFLASGEILFLPDMLSHSFKRWFFFFSSPALTEFLMESHQGRLLTFEIFTKENSAKKIMELSRHCVPVSFPTRPAKRMFGF